jgi:hypothetical protein
MLFARAKNFKPYAILLEQKLHTTENKTASLLCARQKYCKVENFLILAKG